MMNLFARHVIGGKTGKREMAWFVFLLWCVAFGWMTWREGNGVSMDASQATLTAAFPFVIVALLTAHGMEWVSKQTPWGQREESQE